MYESEIKIRVLYADTDQMGVVYYGNYARYYEQGRSEAIRSLGLAYIELEQQGIMMPVVEMNVRYIAPALYDDELRVVTQVRDVPNRDIHFYHSIYNSNSKLINEGHTRLVFIKSETGKIASAPEQLLNALARFI